MRRFLVVALAVCSTVAPAMEARAATPGRSVTIVGRGWGHGRGMGQWGARGMAERGYRWNEILHHYYSGVRISRAKPVAVRVLLDRRSSLVLASHRDVRATAGRRLLARANDSYPYLRARAARGLVAIDRARAGDGPWRLVVRTRARTVAFGTRGAILRVHRDGGVRWYRGSIRVARADNRLVVTNHVALEEYLRAVVPREMPASWPAEALKAQAVAARTYALRVLRRARAREAAFDICATTACQVYGGYARRHRGRMQVIEHPRTDAAIAATRARILTYRGRPILAEYSSSTGGWTISGGLPYMRRVRDAFDRRSPLHRWKTTVPASAIETRWPSVGSLREVRVSSRARRYADGGRTRLVRIAGSARAITVSGDAFRRALGLRSSWYAIAAVRAAGRYRFTFDMGYGARHAAVAELQRVLRARGHFPRAQEITTTFGPVTRRAVISYQRAHRIPQTGFVGPKTRRALNA